MQLTLRICNKWFKKILDRELTYELKEIKSYWTSRLYDKSWDLKDYKTISIKNWYSSTSPEVIVEFDGVEKVIENEQEYFKVKLGKILEVKNYLES